MSYISRIELETTKSALEYDLAVALNNYNDLSDRYAAQTTIISNINNELSEKTIKCHNSDVVRDFVYEHRNDSSKTYEDIISLIEQLVA